MYGKKVDDSHRPSSKPNISFSEDAQNADKQNRDTLKTQRARDVISCGECGKSRLVYSQSKLTHEQVLFFVNACNFREPCTLCCVSVLLFLIRFIDYKVKWNIENKLILGLHDLSILY